MIAPKEDPQPPREPRIHLTQTMLQNLEALQLPIEALRKQIEEELDGQDEP